MKLPDNIKNAIVCGPVPKLRARWREVGIENMTRGERVCAFIENYCVVPEGKHVGQPIKLSMFQVVFILAIYDNPHKTRRAILSVARKNGKTAILAGLLLAHLVGPEAKQNSQLVSGAMSRDQAALIHNLATKMCELSPALSKLVISIHSSKVLRGPLVNTEFKALAADGTTAHGLSPAFAVLDEIGQVKGPTSPFIDAIRTSQGAHDEPLLVGISTQSASDADMLSQWIDDAERSQDKHIVAHVYRAPNDCDLLDEKAWKMANPALDIFRSKKDLAEELKQASRIPSMEASARNLMLNNRISLETLWLSPSAWKNNCGDVDIKVFQNASYVSMGLDLSSRQDLTAAVLAARDENDNIHLLPFCFCPLEGIEERSLQDRAPYATWVRTHKMYASPGPTIDFGWVIDRIQSLLDEYEIEVASIEFDRWRIDQFRAFADEHGFCPYSEWTPVGQGYKDMAPRVDAFQNALLSRKIKHGNHPLLNMAASNAILVKDPAGNGKLDKSKSTQRIDPLVAAVMAVYPVSEGKMDVPFDPMAMIG